MGITQRMEEPYKQPSDIPYQKGYRLNYTIIKKDETNSYNCSVEDIVWDEWQGVWLLTLKKDIDDFLMNIHVDSKGKPCLQTESVTRVLRDLN